MFQSVWSIFEKKLQCRVWCIHVAMKFLKRKGKEFCLNIFEVILGAFKVDPFLTLYYSANSLQSFYKSPTTDFISLLVCQASKCYFRDRVSYLPERSWKILFLADWAPDERRPFLCLFFPFWVCSRWHCSCFEPPSFYPKDKSTYWYMRIVQLFAESYSACFLHTPRNPTDIYREKKTHKSVRKAWNLLGKSTLTICQKWASQKKLFITLSLRD